MQQSKNKQATVGILMLDTQFPRISGDIGNPDSWSFPVLYQTVTGASANKIIRQSASGFTENFIQSAQALIEQGADGITTSCGFMVLFQAELAAAISVPIVTSSLMQIPMIQTMLPKNKHIAILTISAADLSAEHLTAVGAPPNIVIQGTDEGQEFSRVLLNDEPELDIEKAREDIIDAGRQLLQAHPNTGAIVLECTNMAPYAADLRDALRVPVFSMYTFLCWFQAGLSPRRFSQRE